MGSLRDTQPISHSNSPLIMTLFVVLDITILSLILFLFFFFKKKKFLSFLSMGWILHFHLQEYELGHGIEMHTCSIEMGFGYT